MPLKFHFAIAAIFFALKITAQHFIPAPSNPVIPISQPNPGTWNDPSVIRYGNEYLMYLTSKNGTEGPFSGHVVPYLMRSPDGLNWTLTSNKPLLLNNPDTTAWDREGVETPDVVFFNGKYHMYYTAVPGNGRFAIGHAVSEDGFIWEKDRIILTPTSVPTDWMSYQVAEPGAVVFNNKIYLYFTGTGARSDAPQPGGKSVIGLITSVDGFNFSQPQKVLEQGPLYPAEAFYYGYSTPDAVVADSKLHLFYDVAVEKNGEWKQVALHHAYSEDGLNEFIEDAEPIFEKEDFAWTQREIRCPAVITEDNKFMMWFGGDDIFSSGKWGIGYAESNIVTSGMFRAEITDFIIAPNPTYNSFKVIEKNTGSKITEFTISDAQGENIYSGPISYENEIFIDRTYIEPGYYFLKLENEKGEIICAPLIIN
jgi:hypothetical protein